MGKKKFIDPRPCADPGSISCHKSLKHIFGDTIFRVVLSVGPTGDIAHLSGSQMLVQYSVAQKRVSTSRTAMQVIQSMEILDVPPVFV